MNFSSMEITGNIFTDFRGKEDTVLATDSEVSEVNSNIFFHFHSILIRPLERTSDDI